MNGDQQPGSVIQPGSQDNQQEQPAAPVVPTSTPVASPAPTTPQPVAVQPQVALPQRPQFATQPTATDPQPAQIQRSAEGVSWAASEYIAHQKNAGWWLSFFAILLVAAVLIYLITRDIFSVIIVVSVFGAVGYYAARKPAVQQYRITDDGVYIGDRLYHFSELKSFSLVRQGAFSNIEFLPMKRFMPYIPMYYAPDQEDAIMDALSQFLPFESERRQDPIDRLMHKVRF